jgi:hypothetical protein
VIRRERCERTIEIKKREKEIKGREREREGWNVK